MSTPEEEIPEDSEFLCIKGADGMFVDIGGFNGFGENNEPCVEVYYGPWGRILMVVGGSVEGSIPLQPSNEESSLPTIGSQTQPSGKQATVIFDTRTQPLQANTG